MGGNSLGRNCSGESWGGFVQSQKRVIYIYVTFTSLPQAIMNNKKLLVLKTRRHEYNNPTIVSKCSLNNSFRNGGYI